ncbi:MAG: hypothetical protein Q4E02_00080 [Lagierella massiliensis]|nr:hypothetical protein [Lagierella massiliensis]
MDSQRDEKDLSIKNLNISKDFTDISSLNYWENYKEFYEEMGSVLKDNINKTLEKFLLLNYPSMPRQVLLYLVENFNIFREGNMKSEIKKLPNFKIYDIADIDNRQKLDFYKIRSEIYFLLKKGSLNFREYETRFSEGAQLNYKDEDLLGLKASYMTLYIIQKEEDFSKLKEFIERWDFPNKVFYKDYLKSLEEGLIEENIFKNINREHLPKYLENFLRGYLYYNTKDYDKAYDMWLGKNNRENPLTGTEKRYISRIYEYLSHNLVNFLRDEKILQEYVNIPLKFKDIVITREYSYDLSNWKEAVNFTKFVEDPKLKKEVLSYLRKNYRVLPKEVVDYIISKIPIKPFENVSQEEYYKIVNHPRLNFKNPNIANTIKEEFYLKRYEYFEDICNGSKNVEYEDLKEYGFDYSTEVLRVGELIGTAIRNKRDFDFKEVKEKIREMSSFQDNVTIEFYKHFIKVYEKDNVKLSDLDTLETINKEDLVIPYWIYNYIMAYSYRRTKQIDKFKIYNNLLSEDLKIKIKNKPNKKRGFFGRLFNK